MGAAIGERAMVLGTDHVGHDSFDALELPVPVRQRRRAAQEGVGIGVERGGEEIAHRRVLDDLAGIHDVDAPAHLGDDAEVMGDEQQRDAVFFHELAQQVEDLRLDRRVERRRRLVGDHETGPAGDGHGDQHTLPHAAAELKRVGPGHMAGVGNANMGEQLVDACARSTR